MSGSQRGLNRERKLRALLAIDGWWTMRAAGSLGEVDVVALKAGELPRFIEVKSTRAGPWERFGPAKRTALSIAAAQAGATAWVVWWPAYARAPRWIAECDWPARAVAV